MKLSERKFLTKGIYFKFSGTSNSCCHLCSSFVTRSLLDCSDLGVKGLLCQALALYNHWYLVIN